jgi:hypothetical protein
MLFFHPVGTVIGRGFASGAHCSLLSLGQSLLLSKVNLQMIEGGGYKRVNTRITRYKRMTSQFGSR